MQNENSAHLDSFNTLGRSGLIVSPLALGTMTFAAALWGSPDNASKSVYNQYVDAGGNFIDSADVYSGGRSEELVGEFVAERKLRDKLVIATKFGFNHEKGNPHAGGNGRKHIYSALENSLRRLKTDYVDLYWLHVWDMVTPVEEVLQTLGDLVRAGQDSLFRFFGYARVVCRQSRDIGEGFQYPRADCNAARILARRAQHRARTRSGGARIGSRNLPVESACRRFSDRQIQPRK